MTTLTIELPDELAEEARTKGLLTSSAIEPIRRCAAPGCYGGSLRGGE